LENLTHYRKELKRFSAPHKHIVLLAPIPPRNLPTGVKALTWEELCLRLRKTAVQLLMPRPVLAAMMLGFVGAVEQNLLGHTRYSMEYLHKIWRN
jgi:hypothetical protein